MNHAYPVNAEGPKMLGWQGQQRPFEELWAPVSESAGVWGPGVGSDNWGAPTAPASPWSASKGGMTLIVGAVGSDGVVMVSDSREAIISPGGSAPLSRDDQQKIVLTGEGIIGASGAGPWVKGLPRDVLKSASSAYDLATHLHRLLSGRGNIPAASVLCAHPRDGLAMLESSQPMGAPRGVQVTWLFPTAIDDSWRCIGVAHTANSLMQMLWRTGLFVEQLAALCAVVIRVSSLSCPFIGGSTQITASFADSKKVWDDECTARVLDRAKGFCKYAQDYTWD